MLQYLLGIYFSGKGLAASRPVGRGRRCGLAGFATALLSLGLAGQSHAQSSTLLEQWPLTTDNTATVVAAGVTASTPTFTGFVLSDNSTASGPIPGYSVARGQAFAPLATGGGWSSTNMPPGPGANAVRTFYEEFTVVAANGYSLRVDSLLLTTAINNSGAGRLGVSYSTNGFATTSEVTGGTLPATTLTPMQPAGATGSFTNQANIPNSTSGPVVNTHTFRLALNAATGVAVASGQTLSIRLYYGVGSSGTPRQAQLRAVSAKGVSMSACNAAFAYGGSSFCQSGTTNPAPTSTGTAGGTFSSTAGLTLDATTGAITLSSSTPGTYTVTYAVSSTCSSTQTVTVTAGSAAGFSYGASSYCTTTTPSPTVTLATGATAGTFSSTTGLTLDAATGAITLSRSTPGTYTVTNTVAASGGCAAATATTTVTVTAPPQANIGYPAASYCTTTTGTIALGIGTGSTRGTITVNPTTGLVIAADGTITPSASMPGTYYITNTVAASGGCAAVTGGTTVTITAPATATFSYPATAVCAGSTGTVAATLAAGATAGTFSSTTGLGLNAATGAVDVAASTAGTYTVTNTVAASGGCAAVTATASITITAPTTAAFSYPAASYCQSGPNPTPTVTGTMGGTFSATTGLTIDATTGTITLSSSTAGTYTVTYTVAGACGSSSTQSVAITSGQMATFSYPATTTYCAGSAGTVIPTLGAGATAGTFSSTAGLTLNAATGAITLSSSMAGTYTVTNTVAASGGCAAATATTMVTVTPATTATFSYGSSSYCQSGTNPRPTITGTAGGTFSSTTGLTLDAATGAITLSSSTPGAYTVTYAVAGACGSSSTQMLTITAAPVATFSYATPGMGAACAGGAGSFAPVLASGATAGTFTATAGLALNATTGAISLAGSTAGTYTVTNTVAASGGCAAVTSTTTFTVNPVPTTPTLTAMGTPAAGIMLTSSAAAGNQFYLNGSPIAGATGQTYLINSGTRNGSYTVVVTGTGGCASATSAAVTVTVTAVAGAQAGPELKLYPNPTPDGRLTLELAGYHETVQLSVCNALGQQVWSRVVAPAALTSPQALDLSALPTGVYVLQARTASGEQLVRRLVRE